MQNLQIFFPTNFVPFSKDAFSQRKDACHKEEGRRLGCLEGDKTMGFKPRTLVVRRTHQMLLRFTFISNFPHQNKNRQKISISAFFLFNRVAKQKKSLNTSFYWAQSAVPSYYVREYKQSFIE